MDTKVGPRLPVETVQLRTVTGATLFPAAAGSGGHEKVALLSCFQPLVRGVRVEWREPEIMPGDPLHYAIGVVQ